MEFCDKLNHRYVYCISEGDDNFVQNNHWMWTLYADGHKGFCIEYNEHILDNFKAYDLVQDIQYNVWIKVVYTDVHVYTIEQRDNHKKRIADIIRHKIYVLLGK